MAAFAAVPRPRTVSACPGSRPGFRRWSAVCSGKKCFNAGPLSLSLPVVDAVEPAAAVVLAVVVFHESLARSPWELALQLAGAATAVTGIVLLGHCGVVVAEDRRAGLVPGSSGILGL